MDSINFNFDTSAYSISEIAEKTGKSYNSIYNLCINHNLPYAKKPWRRGPAKIDILKDQITLLYNSGMSMKAVGKTVGLTAASILHALRKYNIPIRLKSGKAERKRPAHDKQTLNDLYTIQGKSTHEIAALLGYPNGARVHADLRSHNIPTRTYSEAGKTKYRTDPEFFQRVLDANALVRKSWCNNKKTWIEEWCAEWLDNAGLVYHYQYQIPESKQIGWKCDHNYDFYVPSLNLIIEMDGSYWHSSDEAKIRDTLFEKVAIDANIRMVRITDTELKLRGIQVFDEKIFGITV